MTDLNGIAIVGISCRVPGAANTAEFWSNLIGGVESISTFTREELADAGVPARVLANPGYVPAAAILRGIDQFDASFFGFTPREAALLDPQGRLFMECVWEALEHAGHTPSKFDGLVGVFGGVGASRYFMRNVLPAGDRLDGAGAYQAMIANDKDFIPTWVLYKLNLKGPSVAIQTSCSTSLVAVHMACQSLLTYQCDMAVAGGVSLALDEKAGYVYQDGGILSPDGHCRPFDARAKGTVHGSGAGMVALRRLEDAVASGDPIIAVIKGSAINNDGAVKVGFTAPSVDGQADVISMAQAVAGVDPDTIGFVEAHGTATPLGDPVEVSALTRVFRRQTERRAFCALGAVKSNVGHLDTAAGVTGLIKASLAVEHAQIPPTLHFQSPNPQIDLPTTPFYVNAQAQAWPASSSPRRAGVSSFGIGGTNAHVVVEEAPQQRASGASRTFQLLALSAMSSTALDSMTDRLADAIDHDDTNLADVAFTLLNGRKTFAHRRVVVCRNVDEALDRIDARNSANVLTGVASEAARPITFMFPGQGSQHIDMARELFTDESVFRSTLERCATIARSTSSIDLLSVIYPAAENRANATMQLAKTDVCQLALFSVEYALAQMLIARGVVPQSFIGHSIGEYVAACMAGVFSLEDALAVVAARGRLMAGMPSGEMLAISAPEVDVKSWIDPTRLSIAVVNSATACVVAGAADAVAALVAMLDDRGVLHRRLDVSHAFHSHMMDAALPQFRDAMSRVQLNAPSMPFVSNVTGTWIRLEEATDREYWVRQLRRTVYFADGLREILKDVHRVAIEVGPGRTLQALALQQRAHGSQQELLALLPDARDARSSAETLAIAMARLWIAGADIDWARYYADETRNRVHLPTYPFERERHWIDAPTTTIALDANERQPFAKWFYTPVWKQSPAAFARDYYDTTRSWLVVGDASGLAAHVADALRARKQHVVVSAIDDVGAVQSVERVICFATTFDKTLPLFRSLANRHGQPVVVDVVQSGVQSVTGDEVLSPERATVLGLCRVAPQEHAEIRCRHIDVMAPQDDAASVRVTDQLLEELSREPGTAPIAFRGRFRWTLEHERVAIPADVSSRFTPNGVYWITGGTGGIGLVIAEYLAKTYQARLVLTSRSANSIGAATRSKIQQIEKLGSEVLLIQADASNIDDMQRAAAEIQSRFGEVHGAIHTAGVAGGRVIALESAETASAIMSPKTLGAEILESALAPFRPEFVVYCSSLAVQLGGLGQAAYAAANAYLDARARNHSAAHHRITVSVNWDRWREVGMAASMADADAIGSVDGVRALEATLSLALPEVVVSTLNLPTRAQLASVENVRTGDTPRHARPTLSTDYVKPGTDAEAALALLWQEVLGLGQVGIDDNFFELGGDSLTALRVTALYRERTAVSVPVTTLYAAPTIKRFIASAIDATASSDITR